MTFSFFAPGSRLWHALFWLCIAGAGVLALLPQPPRFAPGPFHDKLEHVAAFAVLAVLALLAFPGVSRLRLLVLLVAYGAAIELAQAIPGLNRDSGLDDWAVDAAVAALVLAVPAILRPRAVPAEQ